MSFSSSEISVFSSYDRVTAVDVSSLFTGMSLMGSPLQLNSLSSSKPAAAASSDLFASAEARVTVSIVTW